MGGVEHPRIQRATTLCQATTGDMRDIAYLEVVDDALPIQKVVGNSEEIPIEGLAPWILALEVRLGLAGVLRVRRLEREKGRDLPIHHRLVKHDEENHIRVSE